MIDAGSGVIIPSYCLLWFCYSTYSEGIVEMSLAGDMSYSDSTDWFRKFFLARWEGGRGSKCLPSSKRGMENDHPTTRKDRSLSLLAACMHMQGLLDTLVY